MPLYDNNVIFNNQFLNFINLVFIQVLAYLYILLLNNYLIYYHKH